MRNLKVFFKGMISNNQALKCKTLVRDLLVKHPALFLLLSFIWVILFFETSSQKEFLSSVIIAVIWALNLAIIFLFNRLQFIVFLLLNFVFIGLNFFWFKNNSVPSKVYLDAEFIISDNNCVGEDITFLSNPKIIKAQVKKIYFASEKVPEKFFVALRFPQNHKKIKRGDIYRISGLLSQARTSFLFQTISISNDLLSEKKQCKNSGFNRYLASRGMQGVLYVEEASFVENKRSLTDFLFDWRNYIINKLTFKLQNNRHKGLLTAMFFGLRQGIASEDKTVFINNGIVHIFTVSGLHVGIIAMLLLLLLRPLPFKLRYLLMPLILLIYVVMSGMNPPAVRAYFMISLWSVFRTCYFKTPALNIVYFAAAVLLFFNSLLLFDAGFLYSFTVVLFLLILIERYNKQKIILWEKFKWLPTRERRHWNYYKTYLLNKNFSFLAVYFIAWLASSGISTIVYGFFFVMAFIVNMIIAPLVWLIFLFTAIQLFFLTSDFFLQYFAVINDFLLELVWCISKFFSDKLIVQEVFEPSIILLLGVYVLLLLTLICYKKTAVFCSFLLFLLLIIYFKIVPFNDKNSEAYIVYNDSSEIPALLIADRSQNRLKIISSGDYLTSRFLSLLIRHNFNQFPVDFYLTKTSQARLRRVNNLFFNNRLFNLIICTNNKNRRFNTSILHKTDFKMSKINELSGNIFYEQGRDYFEMTKSSQSVSYSFGFQNYYFTVSGFSDTGEAIYYIKKNSRQIYKKKLLSSSSLIVQKIILDD